MAWMLPLGECFAQESDASEISEIERSVDSVSGYQKCELLLSLASIYSSSSIVKSIEYCERLRQYLDEYSPFKFNPDSDTFQESDSILDLRADLFFILGQCYYTLDEVDDEDTVALSKITYKTNKLRAKEYFEIMMRIKKFQHDTLGLANAYNALAVSMAVLGNKDTAIAYYNNNLKLYREMNNSRGMAKTYNNLAVLYENDSLGLENAMKYFQLAIDYSEGDSLSPTYLPAVCNVADIYSRKGNFKKAIQYLSIAEPICVKTKNYVILKTVYESLSKIYEKQGNYKMAFDNMLKYINLKDSLVDLQNMRNINELAVKYETIRKEYEIDKLNKQRLDAEHQMENDRIELELQHKKSIAYFIIMIIVLLVSIWAFIENYKKRKSNELLVKANDNINTSLNYASRLQRIIIAGNKVAQEVLRDMFVIYKPRNIVSGDFYYVRDFGDYKVVAVSDCTGHGVPAAFLSVLNITFFNEIFSLAESIPHPGDVLDAVRAKVIQALSQSSDFYSSADGMDCGLIIVDKNSHVVEYAGAYIDLFLMRRITKTIEVVRSTHNPISWYFRQTPFVTNIVKLEPDDIVYMFSDGYSDQVGPNNIGKYTKYRLKSDLEKMSDEPLEAQNAMLIDNLEKWQGDADQIDDILILGIRASSLWD